MDMPYCSQANFTTQMGFPPQRGMPMQYSEGHYPQYPGYHNVQYGYPGFPGRDPNEPQRNHLGEVKTDSKPRLSKEEVEKLEKVFQENPKPSSSVKAQLADEMLLDRPRINNWFQNRRAKAKQEKKQEEYEARRAAEQAASGSTTPEEETPRTTSECLDASQAHRLQPSSAVIPTVESSISTTPQADESEDDMSPVPEMLEPSAFNNGLDFQSETESSSYQSPETAGANYHSNQAFTFPIIENGSVDEASMRNFNLVGQQVGLDEAACNQTSFKGVNGFPPSEQTGQFLGMTNEDYLKAAASVFNFQPNNMHDAANMQNERLLSEEVKSEPVSIPSEGVSPVSEGATSSSLPIDTTFKSPPPPANLASRRKIPRPAALQAASLRSRSYNLGNGPKTAIDRLDSASPTSAMRRISSASGNMAGRIQKFGQAPRSPLFITRNPDALLHYQARSSAGSLNAAFSPAAPPTPLTPLVMMPHGSREATVSSACSDDEAYVLGASQGFKVEPNLKTPPGTPGIITDYARQNFNLNPFNSGVDFQSAGDQPLLTPYFQSEFPEGLGLSTVPSYVDQNNSSVPNTPMYPNMMGSIPESMMYGVNGIDNTQYDWNANEAVSSRSSPGQPRSKPIQFTQNMTPQDYSSH